MTECWKHAKRDIVTLISTLIFLRPFHTQEYCKLSIAFDLAILAFLYLFRVTKERENQGQQVLVNGISCLSAIGKLHGTLLLDLLT